MTITASDVPETPAAPTITLSNTAAKISWTAPDGNGETIDYYRITLRESDGTTFTEDIVNCDGTDATIVSDLYCEVPMTTLLASPYDLSAGDLIIAVIEAHNVWGYSTASPENGSGIVVSTTPDQMATPTMDSTSSNTQLVVDWVALTTAESGYNDALSYNLYWDSGSAGTTWTSLVGYSTYYTGTTHTVTTGITEGDDYQFKVRAYNIHGWGDFSTTLTITAATVPDQPSAASTALDSNGDVVVTWTAPGDNGEAIDYYEIVFSDNVGTYSASAECDGTDSTVIAALECTISMNTLTSTYSLALDDLIEVKVRAYNVRGWGSYSDPNTSGETARTVPTTMSAPTRGSDTKTTQIQVDWTALTTSSDTGNSAITTYKLYWDSGTTGGTWTCLKGCSTDYTSTSFTVTSSITAGSDYQFKVLAANVYGDGTVSTVTTIAAAQEPETPSTLVTATSGTDVTITWTAPTDNYDTITGYSVKIRQSDGTYLEDTAVCDGVA